MEVTSIDHESGEQVFTTVPDPKPDFFTLFEKFDLSDEQVRHAIDRMNISADAKALLYSFSKTTIRAGKMILKIGRKIIDILFSLMKAFPNLTFGIIFGLVVGALISAIPLIGIALGGLATHIAVAFGVVLGAKADFESGGLGKRIEAVLAEFAPLRP